MIGSCPTFPLFVHRKFNISFDMFARKVITKSGSKVKSDTNLVFCLSIDIHHLPATFVVKFFLWSQRQPTLM